MENKTETGREQIFIKLVFNHDWDHPAHTIPLKDIICIEPSTSVSGEYNENGYFEGNMSLERWEKSVLANHMPVRYYKHITLSTKIRFNNQFGKEQIQYVDQTYENVLKDINSAITQFNGGEQGINFTSRENDCNCRFIIVQ